MGSKFVIHSMKYALYVPLKNSVKKRKDCLNIYALLRGNVKMRKDELNRYADFTKSV